MTAAPIAALGSCAAVAFAAGACAYAAMAPESQLFGKTIIAGNDPDEIAVTFDDGPNDPYTARLLDVLAKHAVRATFFVIGNHVRKHPKLIRRIAAEGHCIGNHTLTHPSLFFCSPARVRRELLETTAAIEDRTGAAVHLFRPPYGARRPDVLRSARWFGLFPVMWNVTSYDWKLIDSSAIEETLLKGIMNNQRRNCGSNLLLHDGSQAGDGTNRAPTVAAVDQLLVTLKALKTGSNEVGGKFVTVDAWLPRRS